MSWGQRLRTLIPVEAESNEGFRQELFRESHTGLRALGGMSIGAATFLFLAWFAFFRGGVSGPLRYSTNAIIMLLGCIALLLARRPGLYPHCRAAAILLAQAITLVLFVFSAALVAVDPSAEDLTPTVMTLSVLVLAIAVPLAPWMALAYTLALGVMYVAVIALASRTFAPGAIVNAEYVLILGMLGFVGTFVAAVMYRQRWRAYLSFQETLRAVADLRRAEARLAISESASSTTRLAAAVSHEINSPIGALSSSVDTLLLLSARQATAPPEQAPRLVKLQSDLRRTVQESLTRLQQTASRLARFTNLDQAERQYTRLNDIISDVADLVRPRLKTGDQLILALQPIPEVAANPQRLSAMFFDLLSNSAAALNGDGRIEVTTSELSNAVQVTITDNGRGISKDRLPTIFEPTLEQITERVGAGNWSMFNARQIARENGGTISISSETGVGTSVTVLLPYGVLT